MEEQTNGRVVSAASKQGWMKKTLTLVKLQFFGMFFRFFINLFILINTFSPRRFICPDPKGSPKSPLFLEDLISFSFQVARGMEFLASRKVCCCLVRPGSVRFITVIVCAPPSVYSQRSGCKERFTDRQQGGEDLRLRPGQRHLQRPRLRPQRRRECTRAFWRNTPGLLVFLFQNVKRA